MIEGQEYKGQQYADDFWLVLQYDKDNINEVLLELDKFICLNGQMN